MPKEVEDCVASLIKKGKPKDQAYAICWAQYKKKQGGSTGMSAKDLRAMHRDLYEIGGKKDASKTT